MKKLILSLFAVVCFCCTAMANSDTAGVVVRGEGPLAQYKKALSQEATSKIASVLHQISEGNDLVLDLTPDIYDFYNLSQSNNGPTDGKIMMYVNNLDKSIYDYQGTVVYDIYQLDGMTYVVVRLLTPNGYEIIKESAKGKAENLDQLIDLFASVTTSLNLSLKELK